MSYTKDRSFWLQKRAWHNIMPGSGYNPATSFGTNFNVKLKRTRVGNSNPKWRSQVRLQQNATTDMDGVYDFYESVLGEASTLVRNRNYPTPPDPTVYFRNLRGDIASQCSSQDIDWTATISTSAAQNDALINYLKKVRQVEVSFSGPTFLGELGEALYMIRHPAEGLSKVIRSYLDDIRRLKHRKPKNWKKNLSGLWLEYAFGWVPFFSDINSAYNTYKGLVNDRTQVPVTGYGVRDALVPNRCVWNQGTNIGPNTTCYTYNQRGTEKVVVRYRGMVRRQVDATLVDRLVPFGFKLDEFFPTAWELLPWSFLIDYFSNIGDVIQADVANRGTIAWTNVSTVISQAIEIVGGHSVSATKATFPSYVSSWGDGVSSKRVRRTVTRRAGVSVPDPQLAFQLPGRPAQWANMLALFTQCSASIHPQSKGPPILPKIWFPGRGHT